MRALKQGRVMGISDERRGTGNDDKFVPIIIIFRGAFAILSVNVY